MTHDSMHPSYAPTADERKILADKSILNPTPVDMIKSYLRRHGYDGLYVDDCGCNLNDLVPCGEISADCRAGYLWPDGIYSIQRRPEHGDKRNPDQLDEPANKVKS